MRNSLLEKLRCPLDMGTLELTNHDSMGDDHVMTGELSCSVCRATYAIEDGIPQMLPPDTPDVAGESMEAIQKATIERFGYEWQYFKDWGWLEEYPEVENAQEKYLGGLAASSRKAFWGKSLFYEHDLQPGITVLDAGCGNGRFSKIASETGAEVIGVDLGWGVRSAFDHMKSLPTVHIVRGDLFRLPFDDQTFDRIFSIGVLMHTGNASAAFDSLARVLRRGGLIVAHVYGRGRRSYEMIDRAVRSATTRMPIGAQVRFARATAWVARWLRSGSGIRSRLYPRLFSHINLLPTEIHMFDWWSAPIATHHTLDEVRSWFDRNSLEVVRTNPPAGDVEAEQIRRRNHASVTVLGKSPVE